MDRAVGLAAELLHKCEEKIESITLVPMDEHEALEQMALLGHENFFVFYNANTNKINILYRRLDGTYGLIEPTIG